MKEEAGAIEQQQLLSFFPHPLFDLHMIAAQQFPPQELVQLI